VHFHSGRRGQGFDFEAVPHAALRASSIGDGHAFALNVSAKAFPQAGRAFEAQFHRLPVHVFKVEKKVVYADPFFVMGRQARQAKPHAASVCADFVRDAAHYRRYVPRRKPQVLRGLGHSVGGSFAGGEVYQNAGRRKGFAYLFGGSDKILIRVRVGRKHGFGFLYPSMASVCLQITQI
jgi:hypothetical protein